jgi:thiol-disulfide isomerase/thioredoxin
MSDTGTPAGNRKGRIGQLVLLIVAVVVLLGLLYAAIGLFSKARRHETGPEAGAPAASSAAAGPAAVGKIVMLDPPAAAPAAPFDGPDGKPQTVANLKGKVVVLNLWATWCAPCVKEMPTLAALQAAYAGKDVVVAPLSFDAGADVAKAKAFIAGHRPLDFRHAEVSWAYGLNPPEANFPTTLIFDRQGRERAKVLGGLDWTGPQAKALIDRLLAEKT